MSVSKIVRIYNSNKLSFVKNSIKFTGDVRNGTNMSWSLVLCCHFQGWRLAFTGGICHRYLPVNTGMDNTPKSGVYRHL